MWPFRARPQTRAVPMNDAREATERARRAVAQSAGELAETKHEAGLIRRELATNHFGQVIFEDFMRRKT